MLQGGVVNQNSNKKKTAWASKSSGDIDPAKGRDCGKPKQPHGEFAIKGSLGGGRREGGKTTSDQVVRRGPSSRKARRDCSASTKLGVAVQGKDGAVAV